MGFHISLRPEAISDLHYGDHLCWLYGSEHDYRMLIGSFVHQGLERHEKVVYCHHFHSRELVVSAISAVVRDIQSYLESGQLLISSAEQWFYPDGTFNPERCRFALVDEVDRSLAEGFSGVRFTSEMNWSLEGVPGSGDLLEYEAGVNASLSDLPCIKMCQYRPRGFELDVFFDLLASHTIALLGRSLYVRGVSARKWAEQERRALEQKLWQTQKLESLGVLAGGIAHDFNNMLAGILGNVGLLLIQTPERSPLRGKLEQIRLVSERASELTNQLLAYSGKGNFIIRPLELTALVEDVRDFLVTAVSKKATLLVEAAPELPRVEADATQIHQVLLNLVTNASDALADAPGQITVRTGCIDADSAYLSEAYLSPELPAGKYVFLEVEDTGKGMDSATQAKIFDPFFTTKFVGRGLGLAAVLGIVRSHKGALMVRSVPGAGTKFRVLFPAIDTVIEQSRAVIPSRALPVLKGTALVVDDEEAVRMVVADMLEAFGFKVITAANGTEGVTLFKTHHLEIDVVILDVTMPDINGDQACREMKRIRKDARVIMMSGYSERDAARQFDDLGLAGFLQKPYSPDTLLKKVQEVFPLFEE